MKPALYFFAVFSTVAVLLSPTARAHGSACIDWPRVMSQWELNNMPTGTIAVVQPFTDLTKKSGDEWLSLGLRNLMADYLRSGRKLGVLMGHTAAMKSPERAPDFVIGGSFKRQADMLAVYTSISDSSGRLIKQFEAVFPYPGNKEFFVRLAETSRQLMKEMKVKFDDAEISALRDATASTQAYESYAKGMQSLQGYNPKLADMALLWFAQCKRDDYRSVLGYEGTIDVLTFLGFYNKQLRLPFGSYYRRAEAELMEMVRLARPEPLILPLKNTKVTGKGRGKPPKIENRYLLSNISFEAGLHAAQNGDLAAAEMEFKKAVELVPEDAITWYHLSRIEERLGDRYAAEKALAKAKVLNACVE